ncbi:MAG TPA: sigma-70 family RNA polymerase sigma factor [Flavisolibacter sp.]
MSSSSTDIELWAVAGRGDREAFGVLFRRYYPLLYQYGSKICADSAVVEDAIQELFAELWQKWPAASVQSVKAYLLQALKFKLYKAFRQARRVETGEPSEEPFELSHENLMVNDEEDREKLARVLEAVNKLPARQKEIIYLKLYKGLSYEEVSEIMEINYQVVRNLLCQALKTFRKLMMMLVW